MVHAPPEDVRALEAPGARATPGGLLWLGWQLFLRDFRRRYRQAFFGYFWAVARILMVGGPMILIGSQFGMGGEGSGVPYIAYSFCGVLLFQCFFDGIVMPQWIGRRLRTVVRELPIPYEAIVVAGVFQVLLNVFSGSLALAVIFAIFKVALPATFPLVLIGIPAMLVVGLAFGIFFLPMTYVYLDIRYSLPFLSPILMLTAPIVYAAPQSGPLALVNSLNPLTVLVGVTRSWMLTGFDGREPIFLGAVLGALALLAYGRRFLRRAMPAAIERSQ